MEQNDSNEIGYQRRSGGYVPGAAEEQGAVLRAELASQGDDAEPPVTAYDNYRIGLLETMASYDADRMELRLKQCRPAAVAEFGDAATAAVFDHPGFGAYLAGRYEALDLDADEAAAEALLYVREHPGATPAEAFTALSEGDAD